MATSIEKLVDNIKKQAEYYLLNANEFFPFGAYIDSENTIKIFSAYLEDKNDRPQSTKLINLLETNIKKKLINGKYVIAAIGIDVLLKENEESYDALEIRIFEKDKTYKQYFKYLIKPHYVEFN